MMSLMENTKEITINQSVRERSEQITLEALLPHQLMREKALYFICHCPTE